MEAAECASSQSQERELLDPAEALVSEASGPPAWPLGAAVERLLDDVSDIWLGAVVVRAHRGCAYDIVYVDDGALEENVEAAELRCRRQPFDPPAEVWTKACSFLCSPQSLGAIECVAQVPRSAAIIPDDAELWWCIAYHWRYYRCSEHCRLDLATASAGGAVAASAARRAAADCLPREARASALRAVCDSSDQHRRVPRSWKQRCQERHLDELRADCNDCPKAISQSGTFRCGWETEATPPALAAVLRAERKLKALLRLSK